MDPKLLLSVMRSSWFVLVWMGSATAVAAQQNVRLSAPLLETPSSVSAFWTVPGTTDVFYQARDGSNSEVVFRADGSGGYSVAARPDLSGAVQHEITIAPGGEHVLVSMNEFINFEESFSSLTAWESEGATPVEIWSESLFSNSDLVEFRVSPDGTQIVFMTPDGFYGDLYSSGINGGSRRHLDNLVTDFQSTPDGRHAVYVWGVTELRSVPVDDSQPPLTLAVGEPFDLYGIQITPDGSRVLYNSSHGLFSVPLDASAPAVRLNPPLVSGGRVSTFQISPDGTRAVYLADQEVDERYELFEVPVDGRSRARRLNGPLIGSGDVQSFRISGDGKYGVYRADQSTDEVVELYSADLGRTPRARATGGGASSAPRNRKISAQLVAGGDVQSFLISPDGTRVAYRANGLASGRFELFGVPTDGSATAVRSSGPLVAGGNVEPQFVFSSDGKHVAYLADQLEDETFELFGAPSDGRVAPWRLSRPLVTGGDVQSDLATSSDGTRVLYRADQVRDQVFELYGVPFDRFDGGEAGGHARDASANQSGGQSLAFAARVNDDLEPIVTGDILDFQIGSDSAFALYRARDTAFGPNNLYGVDVTHPGEGERLNLAESVSSYSFTRDSARALYLAFQSPKVNLYSVPVDGSANPIRLDLPTQGNVVYALSAPLGRALYIALNAPGGVENLFSVPVDGSLAPVMVNAPLPGGERVSDVIVPASGTRAAYLLSTNPAGTSNDALFGVPIDGSEAAVMLNPPLVAGGRIPDKGFAIDSGGTRVVYVADQEVDNADEIYSVPIDGSAGAIKLNGTLVAGGDVVADAASRWFEISPDGSRVVYLADQDSDEVFELFSVPIDGSAPPTALNALAGQRDVVSFGFAPDGIRVAYVADRDQDNVFELFSVPSDGSALSIQLSGTLVTGGDVAGTPSNPAGFAFSSDGSKIVYRADQDLNERFELYAVPSAGGAPIKVSSSTSSVTVFWMRPGMEGVLYQASTSPLFLAPLDGSSAPVVVSGAMTPGGSISASTGAVSVSADGSFVAYLADQLFDERFELFRSTLP